MSSERDIRHWYIQKPIRTNCPIGQSGILDHQAAVFQEFMPTVSIQNCEWIKVYSADDIQKTIGMGLTRYVSIMTDLEDMREENRIMREALESISHAPTWPATMYDGKRTNHTYKEMTVSIAREALEKVK